MKCKRTAALVLAALMLPLTSCSSAEDQLAAKAIPITLEGPTASCSSDSVHIDGGQITITGHGIYRLSGTLADGQVLVDCGDTGEVWLILDGADITSADGPCIHIAQADLVHVNLAAGSENRLADSSTYTLPEGEDEPDAALFSRDDLILAGEGSLTIEASYKTAIAGKDDVTIEGGNYNILSVGHGIKGKDSLVITGGVISVDAYGDGLKTTNTEGGKHGFISVSGGVVDIVSRDEGIQATSDITITGGVVVVESTNNGIRTPGKLSLTGGELDVTASDTPVEAGEEALGGGLFAINGVLQG